MGLFKSKEEKAEEARQIKETIRNSECAHLFADALCGMFSEGGDQYKWLIANSKERMCQLFFSKEGVSIKRIEVNRIRLKETGTYDVDSQGWGFGASGFQDLPNSKYVWEFEWFVKEKIKECCPNIELREGNYVALKESAKKGW
ncbi:MAG: hypothetical protein IJL77_05180 [Clostridia bacterium]|nr:hypothetical protein [Clostridia bacterium]